MKATAEVALSNVLAAAGQLGSVRVMRFLPPDDRVLGVFAGALHRLIGRAGR